MRWMVCLLLLALAPEAHAAEKVRVAVAKVRARQAAKPDKLETGIRAGAAAAGVQVITATQLSKGARDVGAKPDSPEGARAASADYLLKVTMSVKKKKFVANAVLIRAADGEVLEKMERTYVAKGALAAGKAIGKLLGKKANDMGRVEAVAVASPPPSPRIIAPPITESNEAPPPATESVEPKEDEPDTPVKAEIEKPDEERSGGEDGILRAAVGGGFRLGTAYTVSVGGQATGLAYSLTPIPLIDADVLVRIPGIGLFFDAQFDFSPVKYDIDVMPPVDPNDPSGRFISAGGTIGYALDLDVGALRMRIAPIIGFAWDSLSVKSQSDGAMQDRSVILSWNALNANGGLQFALILFDALAIELEGRGGYVFSYSEKPNNTGEGGAGFDITAGFAVRYWIIDLFGIGVDGAYEYMKIGMDGMGSRAGFVEDPPIVDATIYSADFKIGLSVMFAI